MLTSIKRRTSRTALAIALVSLGLIGATLALIAADAGQEQPHSLASTDAFSPTLSAGPSPQMTAVDLGRLLFFDPRFFDPRLSGDGSTSCATCHAPTKAWTDGLPLSAGYSQGTLYFRNTPTLLNAAQMPLYDWDGRFAQGDISSLIRDHLAEAHFMNIDGRLLIERLRQVPEYEEAFDKIFGGDVSYGRSLLALTAFVETLVSRNHPYQRYLEGETNALSPEAQDGLALEKGQAGCSDCHGGILLSDGELHAIGTPENPDIFNEPLRHITFRRFFRGFGVGEYVTMREDPGLFALTLNEADRGKFRTPSLLEAAATAPYMHNGVFNTLEEVVEFYNQGGGVGPNKDSRIQSLGLSDGQVASLVAFLGSLAGANTSVEAPDLPPYELRPLGEN